jgi:hypothetical protein
VDGKNVRSSVKLLVVASLAGLFIVSVGNVGCSGVLAASPLRRTCDAHLDPTVATVTQNPTTVEYFDTVNVTALVTNATALAGVELFYQVDATGWQTIGMTNGSAEAYWGMIPPQAWNSHIQYYVNVTDLAGHSVIEDNESSYYRYIVVDTVKPVIRVQRPFSGEHITGAIPLDLEFEDAGSDIDYFEIFLDDVVVATGHAHSISMGVDAVEGVHIIRVEVCDRAGNLAAEHRSVTVEKTSSTAIPGFPVEAIAIALGAGFAAGLLFKRRRFRDRSGR